MTGDEEKLTPEEIKVLKEIAQNISAGGRVMRIVKSVLLYTSAVIVAYLVIWENMLKGLFHK